MQVYIVRSRLWCPILGIAHGTHSAHSQCITSQKSPELLVEVQKSAQDSKISLTFCGWQEPSAFAFDHVHTSQLEQSRHLVTTSTTLRSVRDAADKKMLNLDDLPLFLKAFVHKLASDPAKTPLMPTPPALHARGHGSHSQ